VTPSTPDRVAPLLQQRSQAVFRRLPKALAGGEEDLHQMRVAGRRLRVALPLLVLKPEGQRARRSLRLLRGLTRTGGISRDLDVSVALFETELAKAPPSAEDRILRRRLRAARTRGHVRMAEALLDLEIARLRRDLRVLARCGDGVFAVLRRIRELRDEKGVQTLALIAAVGGRFEPRRCTACAPIRRLRYAAEALRGLDGPARSRGRGLPRPPGRAGGAARRTCVEWFDAGGLLPEARRRTARRPPPLQRRFLEASHGHHQAFLALPRPPTRRARSSPWIDGPAAFRKSMRLAIVRHAIAVPHGTRRCRGRAASPPARRKRFRVAAKGWRGSRTPRRPALALCARPDRGHRGRGLGRSGDEAAPGRRVFRSGCDRRGENTADQKLVAIFGHEPDVSMVVALLGTSASERLLQEGRAARGMPGKWRTGCSRLTTRPALRAVAGRTSARPGAPDAGTTEAAILACEDDHRHLGVGRARAVSRLEERVRAHEVQDGK
jgi:hypothetical protein